MRFATVDKTIAAQMLLIGVAMALSLVILKESRRARSTTELCKACAGYGNSTGDANDVSTSCRACGGSGWTNSRQLNYGHHEKRLRLGMVTTAIDKLVNGHANSFAADRV